MSIWLPSLNALRAFEALSRHLSYRAAAQELAVTPAAVKQLVTKLEASVEAPLVRRKGRGLELTPQAKAGTDDLTDAMQLMSSSVRKMRQSILDQRLIVSVEASFATAWLVPRLDSFRQMHPHVSVLIESSQEIIDLELSDINIAIRYGVDAKPGLISHRLFEDRIFPLCSPALAGGPPRMSTLDDLAHVPLLHWDVSQLEWASATRKWFSWHQWLTRAGAGHLVTGKGLHFSDYGLAVQAAIAGQGMLLGSWPILREQVDAGLLMAPFTETITTDIGYDVVTTPDARHRPEVAAFLDWIIETANRESQVELTSVAVPFNSA